MAKPDTSRIDTLEAIMAEKRKHESYLAKLEDRRASTPAHVFNRLRDEYLTKLTDLQVRASMEAESLSEGLKADEAAVAEIEAKLALVTEERIEGELRAEVGEYDPADWGKKLTILNETIAKIEKERETKVAAFERTRSLLTEARGAAAPAEVPAPAVAAAPAPAPEPIPEVAPVQAPRVSFPTPRGSAEAPSAPPPPIRQTPIGQPVAAAPAVPPAAAVSVPVAAPVAPRTSTPSPATPAVPPLPAPEPVVAPAASVPAPAAPAPMSGGPSFDELAFLNSVVGRASTPVKADDPAPGHRSAPERCFACDAHAVASGATGDAARPLDVDDPSPDGGRRDIIRPARTSHAAHVPSDQDPEVPGVRHAELSHRVVLRALRWGAGGAVAERRRTGTLKGRARRRGLFAVTDYFALASFDFWRAAALRWISPFRAARSSSCVALSFSAGDDAPSFAVFSAVRSAARCDRLRAVAVLVLRMFFFADAILGTD
jgi:hypothetical protein